MDNNIKTMSIFALLLILITTTIGMASVGSTGKATINAGAHNKLNSGASLGLGQSLTSTNGLYSLTMQTDGNLVLKTSAGVVLWASNTNGKGASYVIMQGDGNLVIYTSAHVALWASNTVGYNGASLIVQNYAIIGIYDTINVDRWTAPHIIIRSPTEGVSWMHGTSHAISWSKIGNMGTNVRIELYKGATLNSIITTGTSGLSYSWAIPALQTKGTDYTIRIISMSNPSYMSSNYFNIT